MNYYILSLSHRNPESITWWGPNNSGYTIEIDKAGKYSKETIESNKEYYDNKHDTIAIPCHVVEEFIVRVIPSFNTLSFMQKYTKSKEIINDKH